MAKAVGIDLGDAVPTHEKGRAEMLIADARQATKEDAPLDRLRALTSGLQQVYHGFGAAGPSAAEAPGGSGSPVVATTTSTPSSRAGDRR